MSDLNTISARVSQLGNDVSWIPKKLREMIKTMNSNTVPDSHESCENCAYAKVRTEYD